MSLMMSPFSAFGTRSVPSSSTPFTPPLKTTTIRSFGIRENRGKVLRKKKHSSCKPPGISRSLTTPPTIIKQTNGFLTHEVVTILFDHTQRVYILIYYENSYHYAGERVNTARSYNTRPRSVYVRAEQKNHTIRVFGCEYYT